MIYSTLLVVIEIRKQLVVIGIYIALTAVMTLPLSVYGNSYVVGGGGDLWQTMWRFEHKWQLLAEAFSTGMGQEFMAEEFFAVGGAKLANLSVWPWMWLQVMLGQPLAYNVVWFLSFVLSGYAMYLLAGYLLKRYDVPAIISGVYYMFLPYHVAHAQGHFGAMQAQWLPLTVLSFLLLIKKQTIWRVFLFVAAVAMQAWSEHHYLLWAGILLPIWAVIYRREIWNRGFKDKGMVYLVAVAALLLFFVVLPLTPTLNLAGEAGSSLNLGKEQLIRFSSDPFAYITPAVWHTIWGGFFGTLFTENFTGNVSEATQYLGILPLLLLFFFHQLVPKKQKIFWVTTVLVFFVISLGPRLHLFGRVTNIWLPYEIVDSWLMLRAVRAIGRAGMVVGLGTAVLLAWILSTQMKRKISGVIVLLVILLDFLFLPVPLQSAKLSPAYEAVSQQSGKALIEIPAATNYVAASRALYASNVHGKEVVGSIALERAIQGGELKEIRSLPALRQLLYLRSTHLIEGRDDFFGQLAVETLPDVLKWLDAGAVLVHEDSLSESQMRGVRAFLERDLGLEPARYEDALLYKVGDIEGGDGVFMARDERWQGVGYDPDRGSVFGEIEEAAQVTIYNIGDKRANVVLRFKIAPESSASMTVRSNNKVISDINVAGGEVVDITLKVEPGKQNVEFRNRLGGKIIIQDPTLLTL